MASITFRNVVKHYEGAPAPTVKGISFEIKDKEFVVLVGPSGCGKTTSLRMIAGLEEITSGEILIGDVVVNNLPPKDRDIAMVFQNYALYPHMNVYDNMAFGLRLRGFPEQEIKKRVISAAQILGLENFLERLPKQLSGGQRQRVALGRAIVREPKVFLMDEPLSNLDAKLRVQMRAEIKKLHQRLQTTFVYVTHDQVEAMTMADRIVLLHNGVIQQFDEPYTIYSKPANTFVATFIGSPPMNLFRISYSDNKCHLQNLDFSEKETINSISNVSDTTKPFSINLKLENIFNLASYDVTKLILGIRPEHIFVNNPPPNDEFTSIQGAVDLIEPMGSETYVYFKIQYYSIIARVEPSTKFELGKTYNLYFPLSKIHLFDEVTTKRIPRLQEV